jgi:hypothetical protein
MMRAVLICKNVRTEARQAGDYVFELKVFSKRGKDVAADLSKTNPVQIQPLSPPKIKDFFSTKPVYQEAISFKSLTEFKSRQPGANPAIEDNILLNWKIANPEQLKELKLIGRAFDGSVSSQLKRFNFSEGIPKTLKDFCNLQEELICKNVPTGAREPGDYIFELTAISKKGTENSPISAKTETIKIKPHLVPLKIAYLKVNGKDAATKYLIPIEPEQPVKVVMLSWQVEKSKGMKVELLPTPGTVPPVGGIAYPLSQQPSSQTLTLKVTNAEGQEISKSVTFETFNAKSPPSPTPPPARLKLPVPPSRPPIQSPKSKPSPSPSPVASPTPSAVKASPSPSPASSPSPSPASSASPSPSGSPSPSPASSPSPSPASSPSPSPASSPSPSPASSPSPSPAGSASPSDPDSLSPSELPPRFD